jgi:transcription elongation GreA/GreB family factor
VSTAERSRPEERPPIILTALDRNRLLALLLPVVDIDSGIARFLGEEIARADIAPNDVAPYSMVRMGCEVKFIDHSAARIRCAELVFPEDVRNNHCISILSSIGSALIGLGPGQSIRWTEQGKVRSLSVLEVRPSDRRSSHNHGAIMNGTFSVGDHVSWNSEAGRVGGTITKVHVRDINYKGYTHHASPDDPQYEIKSDKTEHVALHKSSALKLAPRRRRAAVTY